MLGIFQQKNPTRTCPKTVQSDNAARSAESLPRTRVSHAQSRRGHVRLGRSSVVLSRPRSVWCTGRQGRLHDGGQHGNGAAHPNSEQAPGRLHPAGRPHDARPAPDRRGGRTVGGEEFRSGEFRREVGRFVTSDGSFFRLLLRGRDKRATVVESAICHLSSCVRKELV